ncbi:MAG: FAD:protein FMN transferase, partial [Thioalkalispiraceae bacterium]
MYFKQLYACPRSFSALISTLLSAILICTALPVLASAKTSTNNWYHAEQAIMGTRISIDLQHPDPFVANQAIEDVFKLMWDINNEMSNYKPDSLLSIVNQEAGIRPIKVPERLFSLLEKSIYFSELSNGAFDITVGTIGQYYDFRLKQKPSEQQIQNNLDKINYKAIILDNKNKTVRFSNKYVKLDLGGIAKGFAVQKGIEIIQGHGISNAYLSAGGDSYAIGTKNRKPWFIAIKDPRHDKNNIAIPVSNLAISTSGDYERFFIEDEKRYHHILNPDTGRSAKKSVSVTVLGSSPTDTDALSTTLFVLGERDGLKLINKIEGYDA